MFLLDEKQYRNIIIWLEDQKIRRYKIDEREELRNCTADSWTKVFQQYLCDLDCPVVNEPRNEILDWLLSLSVHFEFQEKADLYGVKTVCPTEPQRSEVKDNPLDNLDCMFIIVLISKLCYY